MKKIIVVGGVAGGMSFATRYRRLNQKDEVIVIDRGPYVSFANCGLPYHISGEITKRENLIVASETMLTNRFDLNIKTEHEVLEILPKLKQVKVSNKNEIAFLDYDQLVLSPGAKPFIPTIEGMETIPFFTLRNIPDLDAIMNHLAHSNPKHATVIGAGFIGLEVAENLKKRGLDVTVIEKASHVLPVFDIEMAAFAKDVLEENGITVYTNDQVKKIDQHTLFLESGQEMQTDFIILSVGVIPETSIAQNAGIKTGIKGGILVDERYETSVKDIYAIGDAAIMKHQITKEDTLIALASPANRQGRQLADILNGLHVTNRGSLGTSIVRIFDVTFAATGLNETLAKRYHYGVMHLLGNDHASYYPNATPIHLKVIFDYKTEQILGAQAVGKKGVDKRIDVIATAIKAGMSIVDLQELELTYAPPFGTAKDLVSMAGYVAQNLILGITHTVQWHEVEKLQEEGVLFVDVRSERERMTRGTIPNSIHIDVNDLREKAKDLPIDQKIVLFCESGIRSYNGERILRDLGFQVYNLDGSFAIYSKVKKAGVVHVSKHNDDGIRTIIKQK